MRKQAHRWRVRRSWWLSLLLVAGLLVVPAQAQEGRPTNVLAQPSHFQMDEQLALATASNPAHEKHAKLDAALANLAGQVAQGMLTPATMHDLGLTIEADQVEVIVQIEPANLAQAQAAIQAVGGRVVYTSLDADAIQSLVPIAKLAELAAVTAINYVAVPAYVMPANEEIQAGLTTTEGVAISGAPGWHNVGYRGSGTRIAIFDTGFAGYTALLGTDLPSSVVALNFASTGDIANNGDVHGTACAEIVHDMAPGAQLFLIRVSTLLDLQRAVNYAIQNGIHVISSSIGLYNVSPGDGTGFLANEVARARNAGIVWFTAASNDRQNHWGGLFNSPDNNAFHDFVPGIEINCFAQVPGGGCISIPSGRLIQAFLRWDNWTPPVNQDYDLWIVRWTGSSWQRIGSGGGSFQNGQPGQAPTETAIAATSGANTFYGIAIQRYNATRTDVNFELFVPKFWPMRFVDYARSLSNLADAPAAITVAALNSVSPFAQEPYSSQGPTNGAGGTLNGGFIKPDIAAFANVNTRSYGTTVGQKFNGTSAATPHVAGAAALVRSAYPGASVAQIVSLLLGRAVDMGPAGRDTLFGFGRLSLGGPPLFGRRFDFNADIRSDVFWQNTGTGQLMLWQMNSTNPPTVLIGTTIPDLNWTIVGSADLNNDLRSDLVWRHRVNGANAVWIMNGSTPVASVGLPVVSDMNWRIQAVGDFNGDLRADILWRHHFNGSNAIWFMNPSGTGVLASVGIPPVGDLNWRIVGVGDFNADGRADIMWRHAVLGFNAIWFMEGPAVLASLGLPSISDQNWQIQSLGDTNGDRRSDIFWRNAVTGANILWLINTGTIIGSYALPSVTDLNWQIVSDGDYNGDYRSDVFWRNRITGSTAVWLMSGGPGLTGSGIASLPDLRWRALGVPTTGAGITRIEVIEPDQSPGSLAYAPLPDTMDLTTAEAMPELGAITDLPVSELVSDIPPMSETLGAPTGFHSIFLPQLQR